MTTIEDAIAEWAATRPAWQQEVLRTLAKGEALDQDAIDAIADDLVAGKEPSVVPLKASEVPGTQAAGACVALRSIREVSNVNALLDHQEMTFGSAGLTVVYGDNGSGKSGYARLVKAAVGARHQEPVHGNVFSDTGRQAQKAEIGFSVAGAEKTATWPDSIGSELRAVSFYDEACGDTYIGGDSELTYRPSALVMLDGLIAICDAVRAVLDERLQQNSASRGPMPTVPDGTEGARFLAALAGSTSPAQLDAACAAPDDASEQLGALLQEEARLRATDPSRERVRLEALANKMDSVAKHAALLAGGLSDARVTEAKSSGTTARELRAAATIASSGTFESEPVQGVGSATWRALWEASRSFSEAEAYHEQHFPVVGDGAHCVLCHQELTSEAADRLQRFEAFMADTTAQRADAAEQAFARAIASVRQLDPMPAAVAAQLVELESADEALVKRASEWLQEAGARRASLLAALESSHEQELPSLGVSPAPDLEARAQALKDAAAAIDGTQFQRSLTDVTAKKNDLSACIALKTARAGIETEIDRLRDRGKLEKAKKLTETNGITRKATELTDEHVTALVRDRFTRESDRLRLERIELKKMGGQKGKFRHRPSLLGATNPQPVQQVLSEGEQTALGLAGYFTEAFFDTSKSALVFDDPVTSLDHIRRALVAHRLVQFARDRQVVVFTHDVSFVGDLRRAADAAQITFTERGVQRRGDKMPGLLTDQHPWKAKDVPRRFGELEQQLARIKRERVGWDQDTYEKECSDWAGKLSETWERLINLEIVNAVVDRGTSEVRPKMFKLLARITDEDDREFQQSYARCSGWLRRHDKDPSVNYVAPEPEDLERELAFVRAWFARVRGYRK